MIFIVCKKTELVRNSMAKERTAKDFWSWRSVISQKESKILNAQCRDRVLNWNRTIDLLLEIDDDNGDDYDNNDDDNDYDGDDDKQYYNMYELNKDYDSNIENHIYVFSHTVWKAAPWQKKTK